LGLAAPFATAFIAASRCCLAERLTMANRRHAFLAHQGFFLAASERPLFLFPQTIRRHPFVYLLRVDGGGGLLPPLRHSG
jgi:hypothetical protein